MSRLTKWIESLEKNVQTIESKTTSSKYYIVNNVKLRISDHFTARDESIQIVCPINNGTTYLVTIPEGVQVLTFKFSELKTFIQHYLYISRIGQNQKNFTEKVNFDDPNDRMDKYAIFINELNKNLVRKVSDLSATKKNVLKRKLFTKEFTFKECIKILNKLFKYPKLISLDIHNFEVLVDKVISE